MGAVGKLFGQRCVLVADKIRSDLNGEICAQAKLFGAKTRLGHVTCLTNEEAGWCVPLGVTINKLTPPGACAAKE